MEGIDDLDRGENTRKRGFSRLKTPTTDSIAPSTLSLSNSSPRPPRATATMASKGGSDAAPPLPAKKKAAGFSAKSLKSVVKQKVIPTVQAISGMGELSRRMKELRSIIGTKDEEIRQLKRKVLVLSDINGLSVKDVAAALERAARKRADPDEYAKSESRHRGRLASTFQRGRERELTHIRTLHTYHLSPRREMKQGFVDWKLSSRAQRRRQASR